MPCFTWQNPSLCGPWPKRFDWQNPSLRGPWLKTLSDAAQAHSQSQLEYVLEAIERRMEADGFEDFPSLICHARGRQKLDITITRARRKRPPRAIRDLHPLLPVAGDFAVGVSGVYFLCHKSKVVYIGESGDVYARVPSHLARGIVFDRAYYLPVSPHVRRRVESAYLNAIQPEHNSNCGQHPGEWLVFDCYGHVRRHSAEPHVASKGCSPEDIARTLMTTDPNPAHKRREAAELLHVPFVPRAKHEAN
jgi:hypothetical protein